MFKLIIRIIYRIKKNSICKKNNKRCYSCHYYCNDFDWCGCMLEERYDVK